ncbi:hypothetical protein [Mycobacterium interjectum]|nr:hypothetical protein [Mycobacterium interjectum]
MFHRVPEGKTVKTRVHLDLKAADVHTEADRPPSWEPNKCGHRATTTADGSASPIPKATNSTLSPARVSSSRPTRIPRRAPANQRLRP